MMMVGRKYSATNSYRFGFNGKENDNEEKGEGNQQDYGMRIFDPRIGRFLSVDPLTKKYPFYTSYQFSANSPLLSVDIDGLEPEKVVNKIETITDAGHGINGDAGAKSKDKTAGEANLVLKVETQTAKALENMGVSNKRTRTTETLSVSSEQIAYRVNLAKSSGATVLVSHHFNVGTNNILLMYHPTQTTENKDNSSPEYQANSLELAGYLKEELEKVYTDRKVIIVKATTPNINYNKLGVLKGFDESTNAGILIELGDLNTPSTPTLVNSNAECIGNAIATGMYRYLNNGERPAEPKASNSEDGQSSPALEIPLVIPTVPLVDKTYLKPRPIRLL